MSLFAAGAAMASNAGASVAGAAAAGAAVELGVGVANWNELTEPGEGHVSVNALHDEAGIARDHPASVRPFKKVRMADPNAVTIRNVKITREQMEGAGQRVSTGGGQDGGVRKRIKGTSRPVKTERTDDDDEYELPYLAQDNPPLAIADGRRNDPPIPPEPEDPMLHAQRIGAGCSAALNMEGASANWFTVEAQGQQITSTADGYGLFKWDLSLSQLRYKSPLKEFLSMYRNYRIRQCQLHCYPIKLDTIYEVGSSTKKQATSVENLASNTFTQVESAVFSSDDFTTQLNTFSVPRTGPVAATFIPLTKDQGLNPEDLSTLSFADFAKAYQAKLFAPVADQLPEIRLEYTVPIDPIRNMAGFRCPHPETRYRSTDTAIVDQSWPRVGTFWVRTSETMKNIPLYHTRVRVLVETSGLLDVPIFPPYSSLAAGSRRLSASWANPDAGALEDSAHPAADGNNVAPIVNQPDNSAMQASINTNATNIATLTSSVASLTTLVGTMNSTLTNVSDVVSHFQNSAMPAPTWHDLAQSPYSKTQNNVLASGVTENLLLNPKYSSATSFYNVGSYAYDPHEDASGNTVYHVALRGQVWTTDAKFTNGAQIWQMPYILRPARQLQFVIPSMNSGSAGGGYCTIQISQTGVVTVYESDGTTEAYLYLNSVEYWTN